MDAALGHGIVDQFLGALDARNGTRIHDGRAVPHVRHYSLRYLEVAVQIGFQRGVEMLKRDVQEVLGMNLKGRVVDEHVDAAERLDRLLHRVLAIKGIGDVARQQDRAPAFPLHRALGFFGVAVLGQIGDGDIRALAR